MRNRKFVQDPCDKFDEFSVVWQRCDDACVGERAVKKHDSLVGAEHNYLLPFSHNMEQLQFLFFKKEAEFPGITAGFAELLVGGLLKKPPVIMLNGVKDAAIDWITDEIGDDSSGLINFLYTLLTKEISTCRSWIWVDYSDKPIPKILNWHEVINWQIASSGPNKGKLIKVYVHGYKEVFNDNEFHPTYKNTIWLHELDAYSLYRIREFEEYNSQVSKDYKVSGYKEVRTIDNILVADNRIPFIPIWPTNGQIDPREPLLCRIIDKEMALYNKVSRRNHLIYAASTYTPILYTDIDDDKFREIVGRGLGSWIKLGPEDRADVLKAPTEVLKDMHEAIGAGVEEIAQMGVRALAAETNQSGVALQLRNASQNVSVSTLSAQISATLSQVFSFMVAWEYKLPIDGSYVTCQLNNHFDINYLTVEWMRLITEWYEKKMLPRSAWLNKAQQNDLVPSDYDDKEGQKEINADPLLVPSSKDNGAVNEREY